MARIFSTPAPGAPPPGDGLSALPGEAPALVLPGGPDGGVAEVFARRAGRLRALAEGHPLGGFLALAADLCAAQQAAVAGGAVSGEGARLELLLAVLSEMANVAMPAEARAALGRLRSASAGELAALAASLFDGPPKPEKAEDLAAAPFLGAALQAWWTLRAAALPSTEARRHGSGCPVCGSLPVAGVVRSGRGLRYLHCSLCGAQWHIPRLTCANCGATDALSYFTLQGGGADEGEGGDGAAGKAGVAEGAASAAETAKGVKTEACARCHGYLKLFYLEEVPAAEPMADDLATLALDILTEAQGYARLSRNLFLPQA
ncbi:MAG: formate dehydrogenase accessory protein FdhE [Acidobacteriota bacterium]|jgi:FdhE protein|nr:formate dehydrogenase accessory protein FdhE [Acidobacteriota bacterium]